PVSTISSLTSVSRAMRSASSTARWWSLDWRSRRRPWADSSMRDTTARLTMVRATRTSSNVKPAPDRGSRTSGFDRPIAHAPGQRVDHHHVLTVAPGQYSKGPARRQALRLEGHAGGGGRIGLDGEERGKAAGRAHRVRTGDEDD